MNSRFHRDRLLAHQHYCVYYDHRGLFKRDLRQQLTKKKHTIVGAMKLFDYFCITITDKSQERIYKKRGSSKTLLMRSIQGATTDYYH